MKNRAKTETKSLYFRKVNDGFESEPVESWEHLPMSEAVRFLAGSSRYEILGIERACDGNNHDADGTIEFTDIGCEHSEWFDFDTVYVDYTGWGLQHENRIAAALKNINLDKWAEYYDLWANGESSARHVLAKDINNGETVLFRITNEQNCYYRSAYYADKDYLFDFEKPKIHYDYRMKIKMAAKKKRT